MTYVGKGILHEILMEGSIEEYGKSDWKQCKHIPIYIDRHVRLWVYLSTQKICIYLHTYISF